MSKLEGKTAVTTGGNSGIGLATEIAGPKTSATAVEISHLAATAS